MKNTPSSEMQLPSADPKHQLCDPSEQAKQPIISRMPLPPKAYEALEDIRRMIKEAREAKTRD